MINKKSYVSNKIELRESNLAGKGLFAKQKISKDELLVDFSKGPGKIINDAKANILYRKHIDYMLQIDFDKYFAATNKKELEEADYLNHSCGPNAGIKGSLRFVAMRDIRKNEEITFDYAMSESSDYRFDCKCGKKTCRKIITGDDWKLKNIQNKYKGYFSVYLKKEINKIK